jgi:hypothetical protein
VKTYSRLAIILTVLTVGLVSTTDAFAASREDISSTHTALTAAYTNLRAIVDTWPSEEASFHELDLKFAAECPDVAAGSPQNASEQKLSYEVAGALWAVGYRADANIVRAFIKAVNPLRWTHAALTRRAQAFIRGLREMIALTVPDLCGDVRSWIASGYRTVPASTLQFDQHLEAINVEIPLPRLVLAYVQPVDMGLFRRTEHLLTRFDELEFSTGQTAWINVLETLGLNE